MIVTTKIFNKNIPYSLRSTTEAKSSTLFSLNMDTDHVYNSVYSTAITGSYQPRYISLPATTGMSYQSITNYNISDAIDSISVYQNNKRFSTYNSAVNYNFSISELEKFIDILHGKIYHKYNDNTILPEASAKSIDSNATQRDAYILDILTNIYDPAYCTDLIQMATIGREITPRTYSSYVETIDSSFVLDPYPAIKVLYAPNNLDMYMVVKNIPLYKMRRSITSKNIDGTANYIYVYPEYLIKDSSGNINKDFINSIDMIKLSYDTSGTNIKYYVGNSDYFNCKTTISNTDNTVSDINIINHLDDNIKN